MSKPDSRKPLPERLTDAHLAQWLTESEVGFTKRWRWNKTFGWMFYDGRRWDRRPDEVVVDQLARTFRNRFQAEAGHVERPRLRELLGLLSTRGASSVVAMLRGHPTVYTAPESFDQHSHLLNVANGTVDLRVGKLVPHNPEHLLSKITEVDYLPAAVHADWDAALEAVPESVRGWLQQRLGQACTLETPPDDCVMFWQGEGSNGKSTILVAVQGALGEHATYVSDRLLLAPNDSHPTEKMSLLGARLAIHEELPEGRHLNLKRIKDLTGSILSGRFMHRDDMSFATTHSLVVSTNYEPTITETDWGTWRRLLLVRFPFTFVVAPGAEPKAGQMAGDPLLRQRLEEGQEQRQAVLSWLVVGALAWYEAGRAFPITPARVVADTDSWRNSTDDLGAFIDECLVEAPENVITPTSDLLLAFNRHGNKHSLTAKTFLDRLREHPLLPTTAKFTIRATWPQAGDMVSRVPKDFLGDFELAPKVGRQFRHVRGVKFADAELSWPDP